MPEKWNPDTSGNSSKAVYKLEPIWPYDMVCPDCVLGEEKNAPYPLLNFTKRRCFQRSHEVSEMYLQDPDGLEDHPCVFNVNEGRFCKTGRKVLLELLGG